jgi:ferredoxin
VGSLLGLLSKFSFFKITLKDSLCNSCGLCERACKSQCINSKEKRVDHSRCVTCFNCLKQCKSDSINYRLAFSRFLSPEMIEKKSVPGITIRTNEIGMTRRSFLVTSTAIAASLPVLPAWAIPEKIIDPTKLVPITPPGSNSLAHFKKHCTACHLCVTHCPQQVLMPAGFNFGINYAFKPHMVFYEKGFCNYECTICTEVCPTGAIRKLTKDEKKVTKIGIAELIDELCIVISENTSCGACSEHCPTQAVTMEPYYNGLTLPRIYEELCIGCGGCESICPVAPIKAINVIANEVHQLAELPPEEEGLEIDHDELDFGF